VALSQAEQRQQQARLVLVAVEASHARRSYAKISTSRPVSRALLTAMSYTGRLRAGLVSSSMQDAGRGCGTNAKEPKMQRSALTPRAAPVNVGHCPAEPFRMGGSCSPRFRIVLTFRSAHPATDLSSVGADVGRDWPSDSL